MSTETEWSPYHYTPSLLLAVIAAGLFGATTSYHVFQLCRTRTWYLIPLIIGGLFEVVGFVTRVFTRNNDMSVLGPYIIQAILILIAPALFAASIYIVLGRIILLVDGERYSFLRQRHLTALFVSGDVLSFMLQSNGGGLEAGKSDGAKRLGRIVILLGLFTQLIFFGLFVCAAGVFHFRFTTDRPVAKHLSFKYVRWLHVFRCGKRREDPDTDARPISSTYLAATSVDAEPHPRDHIRTLPWRRHIYTLYITSILVLVRSVFRVVEYVQGTEGYLMSREIYLYAFDALLMFVVLMLFNLIHPSQITALYVQRLRSGEDVELKGSVRRIHRNHGRSRTAEGERRGREMNGGIV